MRVAVIVMVGKGSGVISFKSVVERSILASVRLTGRLEEFYIPYSIGPHVSIELTPAWFKSKRTADKSCVTVLELRT